MDRLLGLRPSLEVALPNLPIPTEQLDRGSIITALVILIGTALIAVAGGNVGHRSHDKVGRATLEVIS